MSSLEHAGKDSPDGLKKVGEIPLGTFVDMKKKEAHKVGFDVFEFSDSLNTSTGASVGSTKKFRQNYDTIFRKNEQN